MNANPGLQVTLDLKGRGCVVIGGDDEAADKVGKLLGAGAKVTVVSPTLNDTLRKLTASAKILHRVRMFRSSDAQGAVLVVNTLRGDSDQAQALYELAQKERFLLCQVDQSDWSTVVMPALVERGHLRIAVSTSGVAPGLASRLRQDLEPVFDDRFSAFLDWLAKLREEIKAAQPDSEVRRTRLLAAIEGFKFTGSIEYPKAWTDEAVQGRQ